MSFLLFLLSLLAVLPAPEYHLWFAAIGVTEWGLFLAFVTLMIGLRGATRDRFFRALFALAASVLFLSPLWRANTVARTLPQELAAAFGPVSPRSGPNAPYRKRPLEWYDLIRGISSPPGNRTTVTFKTIGNQNLKMDIYSQKGNDEGRKPGLIIVHGGSWQSGERTELPVLNNYLAARGYIVAAVDYRLGARSGFPAATEDVQSAMAYLKNHAAEIGLDPTRLVLMGRSAGGQIALYTAYTVHDPAIRGAISFYAPNDLLWGYAHPANPLILNSRKILSDYLGGPPDRVPGVFENASPINHVGPQTPPTLIIHGQRDELVAPHHSEELAERLAANHRPYLYLRLPWATHGCDANLDGPCGQITTYALERFLAAVTR